MADDRKFKFVSPGISTNEIDRSQFTVQPDSIGPVIVGRAQKGPSFLPTKISSLAELTSVFGDPEPGTQQISDFWRNGNHASPLYGLYAAKAYLTVGSTPVTFLRLAGVNAPGASSADARALAGWEIQTTNNPASSAATKGAYGLFMFASASGQTEQESRLASIIYTDGIAVYPSSSTSGEGMNKYISTSTSKEVTLNIGGSEKVTVSFDPNSPRFIRTVLNSNPLLVQATIDGVASVESTNIKYFVGETFEKEIVESFLDNATYTSFGFAVVPLANASKDKAAHTSQYRDAQTPWIIAQNTGLAINYNPANMDKLFKFVSLNGQGEWANTNIKVSIENIRYPTNLNNQYGSFDVVIRQASDTDAKPVVLERFANVNLNPLSVDYISNRIGDQYVEYDELSNQMRTYGSRPNKSRLVRVVASEKVERATVAASTLPFGFHGYPKLKSVTGLSGSERLATSTNLSNTVFGYAGYLSGTLGEIVSSSTGASFKYGLKFPGLPLRSTGSDGGTAVKSAYFGFDSSKLRTNPIVNPGLIDYTRFIGSIVSSWTDDFGSDADATSYGPIEYDYGFSLDELAVVTGSNYDFSTSPSIRVSNLVWLSGSAKSVSTNPNLVAFNSIASASNWDGAALGQYLPLTASYQSILKVGVRGFSVPMFGGFDGFNIFEREPLRNKIADQSGDTDETNYVLFTYDRALNILSDPELVEFNLLSVPGLTSRTKTDKMVSICESRGDAMAVIDVAGGYIPMQEQAQTLRERAGNLALFLTNVDDRNFNSTYASCYYPWVTIRDTVADAYVNVPPSVVALGVMANTERLNDVWFAPAGFNRGGLSGGAAGLQVTAVETKLSSKDRDDLYARGINPIASFPSEGIVVFGQKTLQNPANSALSRINVRRLMIYLKKGISQIASTILFEQNVQATWNDFTARAEAFLTNVKVRFGVDDFKVLLDETTTTPDLVDRNTLYAKIYVKPTRSIEYIALDFIITRSGASFDD